VGDIEEHVYSRIVTVSHVWPGLTPINIWNLTLDVWLIFAQAADDWNKQQREAARG
jgi:hypothetical protein